MAAPDSTAPAPVGKTSLGKRIIAAIIDSLAAILVWGVFYIIDKEFALVGSLAGGGFMLLRDGLNLGFADLRSPGKRLMKLRPVRLDGQPMGPDASIKRNLPLAFFWFGSLVWLVPGGGFLVKLTIYIISVLVCPVEAVLVITDAEGRRWGDKMAGTKVIEVAS